MSENKPAEPERRSAFALAGQTLENPITGERITFRETARDTGGARLVFEHFMPPHTASFPEHIQLNQQERFEILSGAALYRLNGRDHPARAGEVIVVPPGAAHRNPWNDSNEPLLFRHETSPEYGSEVFFVSLFSLARDGKTNAQGQVDPLQIIVIGASLKSQTYPTGIPVLIQRLMLPLLAAIGRRLGYRSQYP